MRKINATTYLLMVCFLLGNIQFSNAQLLKKLKDAAKEKIIDKENTNTQSNTGKGISKGGSKLIGDNLISNEFKSDEFGISGIYYNQQSQGVVKAKFELDICSEKSKDKGAEDLPACLKFNFEIAESNSSSWKGYDHIDGYAHAQHIIETKSLYNPGSDTPPIFQIEDGVLLMVPNNASMNFIGKNAAAKSDDYDFKYIIEGGRFFVKNKEELKNWTNNLDKEQLVKEKIQAHMAGVSAIYSHVESKKNANNEMPSMGKLNTKFIQDRALKTYKEKYDPINKGWTAEYMYVHGNEWVNKKKYLPNGQQVESHRELHVVIVRKNPQGQCKADLMYYVEIFENGKYNPEGKVTGPVSYIGMPGGYLPCEKAAAFKSKLAK